MKTKSDEVVVGLYSFPKSGNTWLRAIIAAAVGVPDGPGNLQKYLTDTHYGKVIDNPWEFNDKKWYFYKSHHKNVIKEHKEQTFETDKILYIHRHPLDVFVSYLNFVSKNVSPSANLGKRLGYEFDKVEDLTPEEMEKLFAFWTGNLTLFPQNKKFGSIFESANNFKKLQKQGKPVHILRYEDLTNDFKGTVEKMFDFLEFGDVDIDAVMKGAEARTKKNGKFFWKKSTRNFENFLTPEQVEAFSLLHKVQMSELGYDE